MADVFISYSRRDKAFTQKFHDALVQAGKDAWVDWEGIPLTADWWIEIENGIEAANAFVFIISPDSVRSDVCRDEINYAVENNKRIIPILHREITETADKDRMHPVISSHNWIFFKEDASFEANIKTVVEALDTDLGHVREHTRLLIRAKEWDDNQRDKSFLLTGTAINEAESWLFQAAGKEPPVTQLHTDYIFDSRNAAQKRQQQILVAVSGALVVTLVLAILSFVLFQQSEANRILADDNAATAESNAILADNNAATAESNAVLADNNAATAIAAEATAVRSATEAQSIALAAVAMQLFDSDRILGVTLAMEGSRIPEPAFSVRRALSEIAYAPGARWQVNAHDDDINAVDISPDGTLAVTASLDGSIKLWDIENQTLVREYAGHEGSVNTVVFHPFGTIFASGGDDQMVRFWDVSSGDMLDAFEDPDFVTHIAFNPAGTQIAYGTDIGAVLVLDIATGTELLLYEEHDGYVQAVAFHPELDILASAGDDARVIVYDIAAGEILTIIDEPADAISDIAFHPDGSVLMGVSVDRSLYEWDYEFGDLYWEASNYHTDIISSLVFHPDGWRLLTSSYDRTIILWDYTAGQTLSTLSRHEDWIQDMAISPDGRRLATVTGGPTETNELIIWDLQNGAVERTYTLAGGLTALAISPDGSTLAAGSVDGAIGLIDRASGDISMTLDAHFADVWSLVFSADGTRLLAASLDANASVWDVSSGAELLWLEGHELDLNDAVFTPDESGIVTASDDGRLIWWDAATGEQIRTLFETENPLYEIVFAPDGDTLYVGSASGSVLVVDVASGDITQEWTGHSDFVISLALSADGTRLATGSWDNTLILWDVSSGEAIQQYSGGHTGQVSDVLFNGDGTQLLSVSDDGAAILWDVASGEILRVYDQHEETIRGAVFTPDFERFITGGFDDEVYEWRVDSFDDLLAWTEANRFMRPLTCEQRAFYRLEGAAECPR